MLFCRDFVVTSATADGPNRSTFEPLRNRQKPASQPGRASEGPAHQRPEESLQARDPRPRSGGSAHALLAKSTPLRASSTARSSTAFRQRGALRLHHRRRPAVSPSWPRDLSTRQRARSLPAQSSSGSWIKRAATYGSLLVREGAGGAGAKDRTRRRSEKLVECDWQPRPEQERTTSGRRYFCRWS